MSESQAQKGTGDSSSGGLYHEGTKGQEDYKGRFGDGNNETTVGWNLGHLASDCINMEPEY